MQEDWNEVICIDDWLPDESSYQEGLYPEGAREKSVYFSPEAVSQAPLRPKWRYLFKESRSCYPWQFWMEIMAYRIGQVMGVPVPPAYVGLRNGRTPGQSTYGALIEWFYGEDERYIDGMRLIAPLTANFDHKRGKPHCLQTIINHPLFSPRGGVRDSNQRSLIDYWAKVLAFDTVIGNTDRHPANWGIVSPAPGDSNGTIEARMSPAFDNGTAMSHEIQERNFPRFDDGGYATQYLTRRKKARHHMQWGEEDAGDMHFFDFMQRFVGEYPDTRTTVAKMLRFSEDDLHARLGPLASIPVIDASRLTQERLGFTLKLIMKRTALLREALDIA